MRVAGGEGSEDEAKEVVGEERLELALLEPRLKESDERSRDGVND